ncbi:MAG: hypothetical protein IT459_22570 [Planctomycetes bacterium]|nr:hypothetical protein [Planctomycetota bacterium]
MAAFDAAEFFIVDEFADVATVNGSRTVNGLLDLEVGQALGFDAAGIGWTCRVEDALEQGDSIVIDGTTYRVAERLAGDRAVVTWRLHRST